MSETTLLRVKNISKHFMSTRALSDVSIDFHRGVVKGLVGENGSGKSTLVNIIAGVFPADEGRMELNGEEYQPKNSHEAYGHHIGTITQEMGTIPGIAVADNLYLGEEERFIRSGLINRFDMLKSAQNVFDRFGIRGIAPDSLTGSHTLEERKLIEMARALNNEPEIFIVDETTTALTLDGRNLLYENIRKVKERNGVVIFISHDIEELMEVCDEITILRDGVFIRELQKNEFDAEWIKTLLVGRKLSDHYYRDDFIPSKLDDVALKVSDIYTMGGLEKVSFELHKGEILGIGGLADCGMHELGAVLFGLTRAVKGSVTFHDGGELTGTISAVRHGMGYISKNRDQESIILDATILENTVIPSYRNLAKYGYITRRSEKKLTQQQVESLSIKCRSIRQNVRELSGGNKQKVAFGKWLGNDSEIFILDCPTRGVDVGVKTAMYQLMMKMKDEGKAIVMITEELPELIGMSDRILIMKNGRVQQEYARAETLSENHIIKDMI